MSIRSLILPQKKLHVILLVERQAPHAIQSKFNTTLMKKIYKWKEFYMGKHVAILKTITVGKR